MNIGKAFLITLAALAVIGLAFWQFFLKDQVAFAEVAAAYVAKQTCSCRFVAEREMASCLTDFTQDVSQLDVSETTTDANGTSEQTVTASALGLISATAVHQPGLGCVLRP